MQIGLETLTDVLCLILFILAIIVWLTVGLIAGLEGNPASLVMPTDSKGRTCGVDAEVREKPYLFYFNLVDCIQVETLTNLNCPTTQSMTERADLVNQQKCAPYYLASRPVYGRCVPEFLLTVDINSTDFDVQETIIDPLTESNIFDSGVTVAIFKKAVSFVLNFGSVLQVVYDDFLNAWYIIIIGILIGALLCFVWCCIMRYVAGIMVWGSILALHVLLAGGIFFCWNEYTELEGIPGSTDDFSLTLSLDSYLRLQKTWLIAGIVFFCCLPSCFCSCSVSAIESASL
ncbi:hypothetical protein BSL78_14066 [Apostichopus japonicus]|uniref:Uncharacterized protein n=1 Tax=Stichopus japonicus TaxID=307972 RepID=A0A2G8KM12_STIJA|nr:hypothetical protein BSL78_14066 [Apostichopus japonicus]